MHGLPRSKVFCSGYAVPGATFRRRPFINRKTSKIKRRFLVSFFVAQKRNVGCTKKERRNGQYHLTADIDRLYMLRKKTQPEANNDKILISVKEACELTGLSEKTMRSLMNENCFMVRIGRRTLIDKKKFQKWIDRQS